jgi:hypothetical protein
MTFPYSRQNAESRKRLESLAQPLGCRPGLLHRLWLDGRGAARTPRLLGLPHIGDS